MSHLRRARAPFALLMAGAASAGLLRVGLGETADAMQGGARAATATPRDAADLVVALAGAGVALCGLWLGLVVSICLVDLLLRSPVHVRDPSLVRPPAIRALLGVALACAGVPSGTWASTLPGQDQVWGPSPPPTPDAARTWALPLRPVSPARPTASTPVHVVRPGESLWSIAEHLLARPRGGPSTTEVDRAWPRLYAANRARIGPDPDLVLVGTRLSVRGIAGSRPTSPEEKFVE